MATEEKKKANQLRLANLTLFGLSAGVWDMVGDSAMSFAPKIGGQVLEVMEKEMGLEIAGESPEDVLNEIARIFVDEFGFCSAMDVESTGGTLVLKVHSCLNRHLTDRLINAGVGKPFICPIMNSAQAALKRAGINARCDVEKWVEGKGSILTFELM